MCCPRPGAWRYTRHTPDEARRLLATGAPPGVDDAPGKSLPTRLQTFLQTIKRLLNITEKDRRRRSFDGVSKAYRY